MVLLRGIKGQIVNIQSEKRDDGRVTDCELQVAGCVLKLVFDHYLKFDPCPLGFLSCYPA